MNQEERDMLIHICNNLRMWVDTLEKAIELIK
jgi:hypothetical protein